MNSQNSEIELWIQENYLLIRRLCLKYYSKLQDTYDGLAVVDYEDLYQTACLAVVRAYPAYDGSRDVKLSTYLHRCIENRLIDLYKKTTKATRAGVRVTHVDSRNIDSQVNYFEAHKCVNPRYQQSILEDRQPGPEEIVTNQDGYEWLCEYLAKILNKRQVSLLIKRANGDTFQKIADEFGVTRQNICLMYQRACNKAKTTFANVI